MLPMANYKMMGNCKNQKNIWNPGIWVLIWEYSASATQEYQHGRVSMVFKYLCILVNWTKLALALEGLIGQCKRKQEAAWVAFLQVRAIAKYLSRVYLTGPILTSFSMLCELFVQNKALSLLIILYSTPKSDVNVENNSVLKDDERGW